jgi:GNAT superfamily N-acetyltransferase
MSVLRIQPVRSRSEKKLFLEFPWQLYQDDPCWIPPLRMEQKELVGYRSNPFWERNSIQTFLAFRGKEVCGRIAAIENRVHNEYRREQIGFFGFFECIDDQDAASGLLDAARQWLAERRLFAIRGPASPGFHYVHGALIEGFDSPPTFQMPYNPPYYARLLESYGFHKAQDMYAYYGRLDMLPKSSAKLAPLSEQIIERFKIRVRPMDTSRFLDEVRSFLDIYNRSLVGHWGFAPMSPAEVEHRAKGLRWLIVPELAMVAEIDGKPVGAVFCLPDYNPRIRQIDGRLLPLGLLRLLLGKRKIKKIRLLAANVLPEYQRIGVGLVLLRALVPYGVQAAIEEVEYSWVMECNQLSRGSLEKGGAKRIKTYRLFDLESSTTAT